MRALGALIVVYLVVAITLNGVYANKLAAAQQAADNLFHQAFPAQTEVVEPVFQIRQMWEKLDRRYRANPMMQQLEAVGRVVRQNRTVSLEAVTYKEGVLQITVQAKKLAAMQALTSAFQKADIAMRALKLTAQDKQLSQQRYAWVRSSADTKERKVKSV